MKPNPMVLLVASWFSDGADVLLSNRLPTGLFVVKLVLGEFDRPNRLAGDGPVAWGLGLRGQGPPD